VNPQSRMLPPVADVVCATCGSVLFRNLRSYFLGGATQDHIRFELFTNQEPELVTRRDTRINCARNCHEADNRYLAAAAGDYVETRDFKFAVACGPGLALLRVDNCVIDDVAKDRLFRSSLSFLQRRESHLGATASNPSFPLKYLPTTSITPPKPRAPTSDEASEKMDLIALLPSATTALPPRAEPRRRIRDWGIRLVDNWR